MRRALGQALDQRMLGRDHEEGGAEDCVGACREDRQFEVELLDAEDELGAVGAADPVALHRQDPLGPVQACHVVEQLLRVVGDAEEPLREVLRLDLGAAAFAPAVLDLLVRQDGLVVGAPLDRRLLAVGQAGLEQLEEQPLRPLVVGRLVRGELAVPVHRVAEALELPADVVDVALDDLARVPALLDRRVLGGEAERVVAHRAQDVHAAAPAIVREDVADRVDEHVAHVQGARRIREHLEHVRLLRAVGQVVVRDRECARVLPHTLPLLLDRLRVVLLHRKRSLETEKPLEIERPWEAVAAVGRGGSLRYVSSSCIRPRIAGTAA